MKTDLATFLEDAGMRRCLAVLTGISADRLDALAASGVTLRTAVSGVRDYAAGRDHGNALTADEEWLYRQFSAVAGS